jgi:primase-polymerase (primpol)-like protein
MSSRAHFDVPQELTALRQWVLWRHGTRKGKATKLPITAMGYLASVTNPAHWSEYGYLVKLLTQRPTFAEGLGFVFAPDDPYCGIDLDDIWQSDADEGAPWALASISTRPR